MEGPELDVIVVSGNVPAFIIKLWRLVEDPKFDDFISWSKSGTTFIVHSSTDFAREILPLFFKHNNFASFVRQLNMYGFRKVLIAEPTGMRPDRDDWEFHHPNFVRGKSELLELVKRKGQLDNEKKTKSMEIEKLFGDIRALENQNNTITSQMNVLKSENELLWRELTDVREKHERQQQIINKLIRFFVSMVYRKNTPGGKRRLAIEDGTSPLSKRGKQGPEFNSSSSGELPSLEYIVDSPSTAESPVSNASGNNAPIILMDNDIVTLDDPGDPIVKDTGVPISPVALENMQPEAWISKPNAPLKVKIPRRKGVPEKLSVISTPVSEESDSSNSNVPTMVTSSYGRKEAVTPTTSCQDRQTFDSQLESITQGLETVQNRLQGENLYIDPAELQELFAPSEMGSVDITSQFLGNDTDVMEELATSKSLGGSGDGSGATDVFW